MKKWLKRIGIALVILLIGLQLVPLSRTNPPVTREVKWDSPETKALAQRACFDCHSNETTWPWYAYVAPLSMQVVHHVNEGRGRLNFSAWDQPNENMQEISKTLKNGEMPLWDYLLIHTEAKLSADEKAKLLAGLESTLQQDPPVARPRRGRP